MGPLGNLLDLKMGYPLQSMCKLAREYGPFCRIDLPNGPLFLVSSRDLVAEVCDEKKYDKNVGPPLQKVRPFAGDGLFTAWSHEPNWRKAHEILMPSFHGKAMQWYHPLMVDITAQLIAKWRECEEVDVAADMTRLTMDTIGLCGFHYRFQSFQQSTPHPFITAMVRALYEAQSQLQRPRWLTTMLFRTQQAFRADIQLMFDLVDRMIVERKQQSDGPQDLLHHMLTSRDPETGELLSDENIRYQIITFLIAGHETTSGLLSFALYFLVKNPDCLEKARQEADGLSDQPTYAQVKALKYGKMVLQEALRLWPTAPAFARYPRQDTVLGGLYRLEKGANLVVLLNQLHRDRSVWGADAEEFRPERFETARELPAHAYKPFGTGPRACIGQQFALHEAALVLGMVLRNFELVDHTNYKLHVKETLTLKPEGFKLRLKSRN